MTTEKLTLVDIGAWGGIHQRWQPFHDRLQVIAFEPNEAECARLNAQRHPYSVRYLPAAIGAEDGRVATFYETRNPRCSGCLRPSVELRRTFPYANEAMEVVRTSEVTLSRLDTVCATHGARPDVLKIDVQGYELEVLRGASSTLEQAVVAELEVEFVPQYEDQPLFGDIDAHMRAAGFTLRGLRRSYWRNDHSPVSAQGGQFVHGDALYVRIDERSQLYIALAAYHQYDLLGSLIANKPEWHWLLPRRSRLARLASAVVSSLLDHRDLRRLVDSLRPVTATDWHDPEFF